MSIEDESPQAKGGKARAEKMTADERKEVAQFAANKRWQRIKTNLPSTQLEGVLKINDTELEVAVLSNGKRIISQSSVFKALGRPSRGVRATLDGEIILPAFMDAANLIPYINQELMGVIKRERYLDNSGSELEGYDASILPLVCDAYLKARQDGALKANQMDTATKSRNLSPFTCKSWYYRPS